MKITLPKKDLERLKFICQLFSAQYVLIDGMKVSCPWHMNYLDLFSGIGGFALGFQRAGWKFNKHYFSEVDKHAIQIYKKHFPSAVELGDVRSIKEGLGEINLITFGFPCQDLSIAGKREGLGGSRSGLFFEATRLIRLYHPDTFIFENVEGLLTSNEGKDFEVVLREIADIGLYECEWQLLNTSWFLPQNRERVYFIGHLGKDGGQKVFPVAERGKSDIELPTLTARYWGGQANGGYLREITPQGTHQGARVYEPSGISQTLSAVGGGIGSKNRALRNPRPHAGQRRKKAERQKNEK